MVELSASKPPTKQVSCNILTTFERQNFFIKLELLSSSTKLVDDLNALVSSSAFHIRILFNDTCVLTANHKYAFSFAARLKTYLDRYLVLKCCWTCCD